MLLDLSIHLSIYGAALKQVTVRNFYSLMICAVINTILLLRAQAQAQDRDHETRLIPVISSDKLKVSARNTSEVSTARIK